MWRICEVFSHQFPRICLWTATIICSYRLMLLSGRAIYIDAVEYFDVTFFWCSRLLLASSTRLSVSSFPADNHLHLSQPNTGTHPPIDNTDSVGSGISQDGLLCFTILYEASQTSAWVRTGCSWKRLVLCRARRLLQVSCLCTWQVVARSEYFHNGRASYIQVHLFLGCLYTSTYMYIVHLASYLLRNGDCVLLLLFILLFADIIYNTSYLLRNGDWCRLSEAEKGSILQKISEFSFQGVEFWWKTLQCCLKSLWLAIW